MPKRTSRATHDALSGQSSSLITWTPAAAIAGMRRGERACQIDAPTAGFHDDGIEAKAAGVRVWGK